MVCVQTTAYALSASSIEIVKHINGEWKKERSVPLNPHGDPVYPCATITVTTAAISLCKNEKQVLWYTLSGELLQAVTVREHEPATGSTMLCAVDADGRMLLSVGRQLVLQRGDHSEVIKVDGVHEIEDAAFEDEDTLWIFKCANWEKGQCKLYKYGI